MKEDRGITLVVLIITIIIMLIITSITIRISMDSVNHSRVVKFVAYMQIIQKQVDIINEENKFGTTLGKTLDESGKKSKIIDVLNKAKIKGEIETIYSDEDNNYRYFNTQLLSSDLGLDNIEDEIVINFATREIVSLNGIEYNKNDYSGIYYTQYLLPTGQKLITKGTEEEIRFLDFSITKLIDGLTATIKINDISITNGTLKYKEENGEWIEISNYTVLNREEVVTITKSGTYTFMLIDNTDKEKNTSKNIKIVLTNPPILKDGAIYQKEEYDYLGGINSTYGAVATDGVYLYVWVPRYAYKIESNGYKTIKFIRGTSLITTDNKNISDSEWRIPEEFSNQEGIGYLELTGIWVKESEMIQNLQIEF